MSCHAEDMSPFPFGRCQIYDGVTIIEANGQRRPDCPHPPIARITHHHGGTTMLCQEDLHSWLDNADADPGMEPAQIHLLSS